MNARNIAYAGLGLLAALSIGVIAQVTGGGVTGGGNSPKGSNFATQYRNGSQFGGTGPGTAGQVLTSNGAGAAPTYQASGAPSSSVPTTVQGDTLFASAANTLSALAKNTSSTRYLANTGTNNNPAWAQVNVANGITGTVPVANGGTNLTASADDNVMVGNGTTWETKALTSCSGATNAVTYNTTTNAWGCNTISGGGTGTTGTFTLTWTDACTTSPTTEVDWTLDDTGTVVTWYIGPMSVTSCTSDSTSFSTATGAAPANLRPPSGEQFVLMGVRYVDNGTTGAALGCLVVLDEGTVQVRQATNGCLGGAWTGSGAKAVNGTGSVATFATYRLHP